MADATRLDAATELQISDERTPWQQLPSWLQFFFRLGERVAETHEAGLKSCAVVIPPVRSYAAAFVATGATLGAAMCARAVPDVDVHFEALASLNGGTHVVVRMGERIYAGSLNGVVQRDGLPGFEVVYDRMTHFVPKDLCQRIQIGEGGKRTLPKALRQSRTTTTTVVQDLLGDFSAGFLSIPTVDTVVIGQVSLLVQELESVKIRARGRGKVAATLGALLRPRRFLPDGGISRSLLVSDRVAEFSMPVEDVPHVAVFDGPRAFARRRTEFAGSSWIAVLDRCSASFAEGVDVANEEFAIRLGSAPYLDELEIPPGTEMQAFERPR
ncbi:hypothetical protein [Candidatus Poriferisodalis sp.]|uniref:hypothetical protein n=1 Tax=Candidatus Poriferisodalis sp. TaxID=3101277 RepID=UPI003D101BDA